MGCPPFLKYICPYQIRVRQEVEKFQLETPAIFFIAVIFNRARNTLVHKNPITSSHNAQHSIARIIPHRKGASFMKKDLTKVI